MILDTLSKKQAERPSPAQCRQLGDSLVNTYINLNRDNYKLTDSDIVTPEYICNNIDFAFTAWKKMPWGKTVSFVDFCEYILPYHVSNEQVQQWRPLFYTIYSPIALGKGKNKNLSKAYSTVMDSLNQYIENDMGFRPYYTPAGLNELLKGKIGVCTENCIFLISILRAAGIPVALDNIPHWGNRANGHSIVKLIDNNPFPKLMTNENIPVSTNDIVDVSSAINTTEPPLNNKELPEGLYVQYIKSVPKVYRTTWSEQPYMAKLLASVNSEEVVPGLLEPNMIDVTDKYLSCTEITIYPNKKVKDHCLIYLCVFDIQGWMPVAFAKTEMDGKAIFKKTGKNIVYLPAVYEGNQFIAVGSPFYCNNEGAIKPLTPEKNQQQPTKLIRKYPFFANSAYQARRMKGGFIEGADNIEFNNASILHKIKSTPFYVNFITIKTSQSFRFVRYVSSDKGWGNIAELEFYSEDHGKTVELKGKAISVACEPGLEPNKVFDKDLNTYYQCINQIGWVGLDLGTPQTITKIMFCPRNDTNCIIPENEYELFYWDDSWISLGIQNAKSYELIYNNVPSGASLWLKCHSGGKEERIFTYENGKQVWW